MKFIDFPFPFDDKITSQDILRTRREKLGLTQQQVAAGAKLQLRQYQRIESGERNLETATLKTALAICAVLKIDPYTFLPEGEIMNKYCEINLAETSVIDTEETFPLLLMQACELYNDSLGTDYSLDNIKIEFCTLDNVVEKYNSFTSKYGFHSEKRVLRDFETFLAEAFVGQTDIDAPDHVDGLLVRVDPPKEFANLQYYKLLIVHELAHIFCTTHEIDSAGKAGQRFFDLYCADDPKTSSEEYIDGQINAGYAIWREFIAEIIQNHVYEQPAMYLKEITKELKSLANLVRIGNPNAKSVLHRYLAEIILSVEGVKAESWDELETHLKKHKLPFIQLIHHVFEMLEKQPFFMITPDEIADLGAMYMSEAIMNTPKEELVKFAASYGLM